jgi:hypothetical protein
MLTKLSKQEKLILVALALCPDVRPTFELHAPWRIYQRLLIIVAGIDPNKYGRIHETPYVGRQLSNKAFATVLRSLSRLEQRELISWQYINNKRYPVLNTSINILALFPEIANKVQQLDNQMEQRLQHVQGSLDENEQRLAYLIRQRR